MYFFMGISFFISIFHLSLLGYLYDLPFYSVMGIKAFILLLMAFTAYNIVQAINQSQTDINMFRMTICISGLMTLLNRKDLWELSTVDCRMFLKTKIFSRLHI